MNMDQISFTRDRQFHLAPRSTADWLGERWGGDSHTGSSVAGSPPRGLRSLVNGLV